MRVAWLRTGPATWDAPRCSGGEQWRLVLCAGSTSSAGEGLRGNCSGGVERVVARERGRTPGRYFL